MKNLPPEVLSHLIEAVNSANSKMLELTGKPLEAVTAPVEMQMFDGAKIAGIPVLTRTAALKFGPPDPSPESRPFAITPTALWGWDASGIPTKILTGTYGECHRERKLRREKNENWQKMEIMLDAGDWKPNPIAAKAEATP